MDHGRRRLGRRELGAAVDNRQGDASFSPDGASVYFTVDERGDSKLYRLPVAGGPAEAVVAERGRVTGYALGPSGSVAFTFTSDRDLAQLHLKEPLAPRVASPT